MQSSFLGAADVSPMIERERENYKLKRADQPTGIRGMFNDDWAFSPPDENEGRQ